MSFDILNCRMVVPATANRLPQIAENEALIERLLEMGISSSSFFMPEDELARFYPNNNAKTALNDLFTQLPPAVRNELLPGYVPPTCKKWSFLRWTSVFSTNRHHS